MEGGWTHSHLLCLRSRASSCKSTFWDYMLAGRGGWTVRSWSEEGGSDDALFVFEIFFLLSFFSEVFLFLWG
ncbi:hypothetical protein COCSADRAFT_40044 [Bipolaris sorokiniana ND90Pr]|uniref:Uncharacterized protein n=1 Tax=Cochliobolus sativus (strain ND90Pr / ATCC 201652) TaxID=665912 RepID=M2SD39_COCSN|nr:uncharacterized protein COCSADRAFT_40044 [Bipolaris sorokiniana ND90Pr]EMD60405.1 hypothetical protein COCSADRAFT_40044 [Bipolaris sorokiniana ND90Pr]